MTPTPTNSETNTSIALRAFAMLEAIVNAPGPMSLDELTSELKLPKPTVFRIVTMLKEADLLLRESAGKRYVAGPRLLSFGIDMWRSNTLRVQWHRALEDTVAECGECCNLTLLEGNQVLYIDRVETSHPLRLHLDPGTRVPLHCTASGKLFLSQMSPEDAKRTLGDEPYERFTSKTIVSFGKLQLDLEKVRKTGVGTHDSELFNDSVAIAVPVLGRKGEIVAAVAMHAPSSRASIDTCLGFIDSLRKAASTISSTMSPVADTSSDAVTGLTQKASRAAKRA
ncbi:MAG: IclR family transcriptional regulator [Sulfuritalea sp.]|jgi:IclR family acetate operon transcriptional repressor|uniref:IclR family transcriptional regulator n=1 Tax=Sulfuritalea sp. TaxID=2480090 RepID=UPI001ACE09E4|nr:IclR family transcriptional regulator [Sulfuritalea sp.]MBN8473298.1 IclR family transcriptional regulator [Sulfuritalea sp.]MDK9714499.1 IclR family transcriptional regulator [Sulfuritalea sp.]